MQATNLYRRCGQVTQVCGTDHPAGRAIINAIAADAMHPERYTALLAGEKVRFGFYTYWLA